MNNDTLNAFQQLSDILDTLRIECPWDRVQTMESLRYLTIEETYELSEAILKTLATESREDLQHADSELKKELGDLFMHLLFYCKIAEDEKRFTLEDVLRAISQKLIDRHPFIYRKEEYGGESWEQLKMHEGRKSVLEGVPASLPTLVKAMRIQEKASGIGYQQSDTINGLSDEMTSQQFGDYLFNLVNWAHQHGINADDALAAANLRFTQKVQEFEK